VVFFIVWYNLFMKLVIGMPTGGTIRAETVASLIGAMNELQKHDIYANLSMQLGGYVAPNRNRLVQNAIDAGATHLMFIDADMIFPADGIWKLIQHKKDIVGANYNVRMSPTSEDFSGPTISLWDPKKKMNFTPRSKDLSKELFQVYTLATGFMLIDLNIFKKLKKPYFIEWSTENNEHMTEDVYFCKEANKVGIELFCDPTIEMGHIGSYAY